MAEREPDGRLCPVCWTSFTPTGRQFYCTDTCRKSAWSRRRTRSGPTPQPAVSQRFEHQPPATYACPRCHEHIALTDLLNAEEPPNR